LQRTLLRRFHSKLAKLPSRKLANSWRPFFTPLPNVVEHHIDVARCHNLFPYALDLGRVGDIDLAVIMADRLALEHVFAGLSTVKLPWRDSGGEGGRRPEVSGAAALEAAQSELPSAAGRVFSFLSDNSDVVREEIVRQPDACRVVKVDKQA